MAGTGNPRRSAVLLPVAGVFFLPAAASGKQTALAGTGVALLAIAGPLLRRRRQGGEGGASG